MILTVIFMVGLSMCAYSLGVRHGASSAAAELARLREQVVTSQMLTQKVGAVLQTLIVEVRGFCAHMRTNLSQAQGDSMVDILERIKMPGEMQ